MTAVHVAWWWRPHRQAHLHANREEKTRRTPNNPECVAVVASTSSSGSGFWGSRKVQSRSGSSQNSCWADAIAGRKTSLFERTAQICSKPRCRAEAVQVPSCRCRKLPWRDHNSSHLSSQTLGHPRTFAHWARESGNAARAWQEERPHATQPQVQGNALRRQAQAKKL